MAVAAEDGSATKSHTVTHMKKPTVVNNVLFHAIIFNSDKSRFVSFIISHHEHARACLFIYAMAHTTVSYAVACGHDENEVVSAHRCAMRGHCFNFSLLPLKKYVKILAKQRSFLIIFTWLLLLLAFVVGVYPLKNTWKYQLLSNGFVMKYSCELCCEIFCVLFLFLSLSQGLNRIHSGFFSFQISLTSSQYCRFQETRTVNTDVTRWVRQAIERFNRNCIFLLACHISRTHSGLPINEAAKSAYDTFGDTSRMTPYNIGWNYFACVFP